MAGNALKKNLQVCGQKVATTNHKICIIIFLDQHSGRQRIGAEQNVVRRRFYRPCLVFGLGRLSLCPG